MATPADPSKLPVPWPQDAALKFYAGGCHCKAIRYKFEYPEEFYSLPAVRCNCSICFDRGVLNVYAPIDKFEFTTGTADDMTEYEFGGNKVKHRFCRTCGSHVGASVPCYGLVVVNTRTLDELELEKLQIKDLDFKNAEV
ncbi:Mss4-like protein [Roridomyces roridus]|uniref:Mss4-like protein n=1 Tax=Roridomyces roridus TaxID=1738132 RepID=A0AAD7FUU8_9AGAR|nr:Mss4-like protein [Roridomyces roridus]